MPLCKKEKRERSEFVCITVGPHENNPVVLHSCGHLCLKHEHRRPADSHTPRQLRPARFFPFARYVVGLPEQPLVGTVVFIHPFEGTYEPVKRGVDIRTFEFALQLRIPGMLKHISCDSIEFNNVLFHGILIDKASTINYKWLEYQLMITLFERSLTYRTYTPRRPFQGRFIVQLFDGPLCCRSPWPAHCPRNEYGVSLGRDWLGTFHRDCPPRRTKGLSKTHYPQTGVREKRSVLSVKTGGRRPVPTRFRRHG